MFALTAETVGKYAIILLALVAFPDVQCAKCNPLTCNPQDCRGICDMAAHPTDGTQTFCFNCDPTMIGNLLK